MSTLVQEKKYTFQLCKANPANTANGLKYPPQVAVPSNSYMFKDGKLIEIRYAVGESTIIKSEQSQHAQTAPAIIITDGRVTLKEREGLALEYLRSTIFNEANNYPESGFKSLFKELDFNKIAEDATNKVKLAGEATVEFWKLHAEDSRKLRAIARRLIPSIDVKNPAWILPADSYVKRNPDEFLKFIRNTRDVEFAERLDYLVEAEERNIISFGLGSWSWVGGGEITSVPRGLDKHEELTNWTYTNSRGNEVWAKIAGKLKGVDVDKLAQKIERKVRGIATEVHDMDLDELIAEGKKAGVITREGINFAYNELDGNQILLDKSNKSINEFLEKNPKALEDLKNRISAFKEDNEE